MTDVDAALLEITGALATLEPQLEGLRDYQRLNLHDDTRAIIESAIVDYARRETLLFGSRNALDQLRDDGYPSLEVREVAQAVYADLAENKATVDAALAQFAPLTAATLRTTAGPAEPKSPAVSAVPSP